ncbi:MAG: hypothetical protein Q9190_006559 [Brigantiaea leucoxantha]
MSNGCVSLSTALAFRPRKCPGCSGSCDKAPLTFFHASRGPHNLPSPPPPPAPISDIVYRSLFLSTLPPQLRSFILRFPYSIAHLSCKHVIVVSRDSHPWSLRAVAYHLRSVGRPLHWESCTNTMVNSNDENDDGRDLPRVPAEVRGTLSESSESVPPHAPSTSPLSRPPTAMGSSSKPKIADSHPMTTNSSSTSTSLSSTHGANLMDVNGPSPYGTRSRNRTGNTRPNYAEDREQDTDYDWVSTKKLQNTSNQPSSNSLPTEDSEGSGVNTRRRSLTTTNGSVGSKSIAAASIKDQIPGMSSFSVNPESHGASQPPTKKRRAPGAVPTSASATTNTISSTANGVSRKSGAAAHFHSNRETNMLSFETSQGFLKNGKLKADDGTALGVDGA